MNRYSKGRMKIMQCHCRSDWFSVSGMSVTLYCYSQLLPGGMSGTLNQPPRSPDYLGTVLRGSVETKMFVRMGKKSRPLVEALRCHAGHGLRSGRVVAQAIGRWLPTAAARVRIRAACGVCGGQNGTGAGFLRVLRFPLPIIPPISTSS
jgi:hypothetical protein